jgi:lipopolysaccharide biosynthesis protein/SAM-dependent methyltransferase
MSEIKLPPDGERYLPEFKGTIELEHLHRYQLARTLTAGRDVLDIACGEGYGADILAATAKSVVGVDISPEAIEHAKSCYRDPRIFFRVGSATDIPIPDASVDMVVSFETIEHLEDHDRMMQELRRVLRPGGLLMISSPNKLEYSDKPGYSNRFHVRELYTEEFVTLVSRHFTTTKRYGQKLSAASLIAHDADAIPFHFFAGTGVRNGIPEARYDIILAGDGELPEIPNSAYEIPDSPLQPYAAETFQKDAATQAITLREARRKADLDAAVAQEEMREARRKADLDAAVAQEEMREIVAKLEASEFLANELNKYLTHATTLANDLLASKWWRMTRHLRRWSNSLRKRRGRPKKRWVDQVDLPAVSVQMQLTTAGEDLWHTHTPVAGAVSPFGRSNAGPSIPVVPYSTIREDFVAYADHDPIESAVRAIAFYLPQFHPFAQNDEWWGTGFTEWTNVGKARPLFPGHHQPHCPIHLGYYDLRVPQIMQEQARLARNYGISGFAYYFYWFAGQLLMEAPLEAMLADPDVDLPFCMIWANENWTRRWDGQDQEVLIAQDHSLEDSRAMLTYLQKFMEDRRYIRVNGKPLFIIYRATLIPDFVETLKMWRSEAKRMGLGDLYVVSAQTFGHMDPKEFGLDAAIEFPPHGIDVREISTLIPGLVKDFSGKIYEYPEVVSNAARQEDLDYMLFRTTMLSWDNTARRNRNPSIFTDFSLTRYSQWLASNMERAAKDPRRSDGERLVFINAWNEWAEGTHLEPDQKHGFGYLEATRSVIRNYSKDAEVFMRPAIPDTTTARFAIVAHLHYADTWPELRNAIAMLSDVDVYVTVTNVDLAQTVAADMPSAIVELVDNRGRDVRPFLLTMQRISHLGYRAVCKVHGKKSVYRVDGDSLRQQLFTTLINAELMTRFDQNERLGFIATASSMLPHDSKNMRDNQKLVDEISLEMGIPFVRDRFASGTMFWVDPRAIEPIIKLRINDFDIERGLADGTRAHAIERLFCVVCEAKGFDVGTVGEARRDLGISVAHRNQTSPREVGPVTS